ncbi:Phorbol-ester/DAG-type domain-containing protein [Entamoeba marina]
MLRSESETLYKLIVATENIDKLNTVIEDLSELIRDHYYHRSMFHSIQRKCIEILNDALKKGGYKSNKDIEKLYLTPTTHTLFIESLDESLKPYDYLLKEIFSYVQKFKKPTDVKEPKTPDELQTSGRLSMVKKFRRGSDFSSIVPFINASPISKSAGKDNTSYAGELQDVQDFIRNISAEDHPASPSEAAEKKDELNTITHIFEVNGTIWASSKAEGNKSELKTYESLSLGVIEQTTLPSRVTAISNVGNYVFCGSEAGTINIYNGRIMQEVECNYCVQSSIVEIGSKGLGKDSAWFISDQSEFAVIEIGKKMKFKLSRLKIPSMVTCACVCGKKNFPCEFPPSSKTKFSIFKDAPQFAVSSISASRQTIWFKKGTQPKTINMKKINTLTPFLNDMWCCCGDGSVIAVDITTLKVSTITKESNEGEVRGGCILNIEDMSQQISNYSFFYGINDSIKKVVTDYYRHSFNKNTIEGQCSKCKGKVHKNQGLKCAYCSIFLHLDCANLTKLEKICSRDKSKLTKPTVQRTSSVSIRTPSFISTLSPSPTKLTDSFSDS